MENFTKEENQPVVPVCEKYTLTIREAAAYFNIGIKKMRRMAEENTGRFLFLVETNILLSVQNLRSSLMIHQKYNLA